MCDKQKFENGKQTVECKRDSFFNKDIHYNGNKSKEFSYPPLTLPEMGVTTEEEIYELFPGNPEERTSYKKLVKVKIKGKYIEFDKLLLYDDDERTEKRYRNKDGSYVYKRQHSEYLDFYIFLNKGIVVYYTTKHFIKSKKNNWVPGKYHNGYAKSLRGEPFPGRKYTGCIYMMQRPDALCVFGETYTQTQCDQDLKMTRPWR